MEEGGGLQQIPECIVANLKVDDNQIQETQKKSVFVFAVSLFFPSIVMTKNYRQKIHKKWQGHESLILSVQGAKSRGFMATARGRANGDSLLLKGEGPELLERISDFCLVIWITDVPASVCSTIVVT